MTDTNVKESSCDARRKDIYGKLETIRTEIDTMKGGIKFAIWIIPIFILMGCTLLSLQIQNLRLELKQPTRIERKMNTSLLREFPQGIEVDEIKSKMQCGDTTPVVTPEK